MIPMNWLLLASGGLLSGVLAGFLGIGGGTVLVPLLVAVGYTPVQAVATSTLAISITAVSGSLQNWRMGYFNFRRVIFLGLPALVTAQIGAYLAGRVAPDLLLFAFGLMLLSNVYLVGLRKRVVTRAREEKTRARGENARPLFNLVFSRIATGGIAGLLAGLFGVGGGVIMVPLQIFLLGETIKVAIQTSLGVIVITAISACAGHALGGNVLFLEGVLLGAGGLLGVQFGTRYLPKLSDKVVGFTFRVMLVILSVYVFWQAWRNYFGP
jgi:uncharacterized membrane protein YfcA